MQMNYQPPQEEQDPLEAYTINFSKKAKDGQIDPVIGRDSEIRRVIQILSRRSKNNPVLLGDPGVGKTAIIEGLAQRIVDGDVPDTLKNKEVVSLDLAGLLAGAAYRGEFEQRLKNLVKKITESDGKYILFIDELHTIVGAGGAQGAVDASNMLKPALARGELRAIGATTIKEYRQYIEKDQALERRFQPVFVEEPTKEDTLAILRGIKEKYEVHHGIKISDDALISAVELSTRYIADRFLPDKAIDLIDEAASSAKIEVESMPSELDEKRRRIMQLDIELAALKKEQGVEDRKNLLENERNSLKDQLNILQNRWHFQKEIIQNLQKSRAKLDSARAELEQAQRDVDLNKAAELQYGKIPEIEKNIKEFEDQWANIKEDEKLLREAVTEEDIALIVSRWTHIPVTRLLSSESIKLAKLEDELQKKVIGQDEALQKTSRAIRRSRAGLKDEQKPIGSFLFLGPTGVGKTETARAIAESLFNDKNAMVRIDMSEYQEPHSLARLIGSPPGYVGFEEGGQLTEIVRRHPYSVILFDEVEKAHPQIFNAFLQILDDGRLTDGKGRVVDFKNTIIILTSNIGSDIYSTEKDKNKRDKAVMDRVKNFFKPEFINRLDSLIIFNPLNEEVTKKIVDLQLLEIVARLEKKGYHLKTTEKLAKYLTAIGFDPVYGARPLKRIITELILDEVSLQIIEGKIKSGDTISADLKGSKVEISVEKPN
jgi:ATP-dependent Clp protease ATP-binding subunit ClpB